MKVVLIPSCEWGSRPINLQMDISITENLYEKSVSHYIDYFDFSRKYSCI